MAAVVKKQRAATIVEPQHSKKKSHVTDTRGDECFLCGCCGRRSLDPETNEQIRREPHKFPKHEKQQQTVRNNHSEHRAGEERQISKKPGEISVVSHVADAEHKNRQTDQ